MANAYGRRGAARTSSAQRGQREEFVFDPTEATEYLTAPERTEYTRASETLAGGPKLSSRGRIQSKKRRFTAEEQGRQKLSRLADIASARAVEGYEALGRESAKGMQSVRARGNTLIKGRTFESGVGSHQQFGGEVVKPENMGAIDAREALKGSYDVASRSLEEGTQTREMLSAAERTGQMETAELGDPKLRRSVALREKRRSRYPSIPGLINWQTNVTDPTSAYLGTGGTRTGLTKLPYLLSRIGRKFDYA